MEAESSEGGRPTPSRDDSWKSVCYANSEARTWICSRVNPVYQHSLRLLSLRRILMLRSQHFTVLQKNTVRKVHLENSVSECTPV